MSRLLPVMYNAFSRSCGLIRLVSLLSLALCGMLPLWLWADAPAWWAERGVITSGATPDDYAAVNQGQVKHIAKQAYEEMQSTLVNVGGAGAALDAIWANPSMGQDDYNVINLGQLKNVAAPFYNRLHELNYTGGPLTAGQTYPWHNSPNAADDYAVANIGQVKNLFSFSLGTALPGSSHLTIVSGDNQSGASGAVLPQSLVVKVTDANGQSISGQTVTFALGSGSGALVLAGNPDAPTFSVPTGLLGEARIELRPVGEPGSVNEVQADISGSTVTFRCHVSTWVASAAGVDLPPDSPASEAIEAGGGPETSPPSSFPSEAQLFAAPTGLTIQILGYDTTAPLLKWQSNYENHIVERRVGGDGEWVPVEVEGKQYQESGLIAGQLYEYRVRGLLSGGTRTAPGEERAYDVARISGADVLEAWYEGEEHEVYYPYWTFGRELNTSNQIAIDVGRSVHGGKLTLYVYSGFYDYISYDIYLNESFAPLSFLESSRYEWYYNGFAHLAYSAHTKRVEGDGEHEGFDSRPAGGEEGTALLEDDSPYYVYYKGTWISSYSIPQSGLDLSTGRALSLKTNVRINEALPVDTGEVDGDGFPVYITAPNAPLFLYWSGIGTVVQTNSAGIDSGTPVYDATITLNQNALDGDSNTITFTASGDVVNGTAVPPLKINYVTNGNDDPGVNIPTSESSGAKYRKVALNGAPLSDEKPQQESETDQSREETFVDALTLGLRHDTTDIYMAVPAADMALSVRRTATSEIWNLKSGLRPSERPDRPFGAGWTTNLAANIHFSYMVGSTAGDVMNPDTATVTDENGAEYSFAILYGATSTYSPTTGYSGPRTFVPLPSSNHEQSIYLCSLTANTDGTYTFKRKFGSTLVYSMTSLSVTLASDRIKGSSSGTKHTYACLSTVEDRYGNRLNYSYGSTYTLIPATISVYKSDNTPGATLSIRQDSNGRIIDVWDPSGYKVHYDYSSVVYSDSELTPTPQNYDYSTLSAVTTADGKTTHYTRNLSLEADQNPVVEARVGNYHHLDLSAITDPLNRTYAFSYLPDHTKHDYSSDAPGDHYYVKTGLPFQVAEVTLPDGSHASFINNSSNLKIARNTTTGVETMVAGYVRRNTVIDALGNQRDYDFNNVRVEELPSFATAYKQQSEFDNPRMVYYQTMTITPYTGNGTGKAGMGGQETFSFSPDAGMAVTEATDFSGNTTTYAYEDPFTGSASTEGGLASGVYGYYGDPTSQTNALNKTKTFTYGANRIMTSSTDENGVKTQWTVDSLGRRTEEQVFPSGSTTAIQHTVFTYDSTTFPNFMTKKTVKKLAAVTTDPSWVQDLVTLYVPDTNGRVAQQVVDMNGNGTVDTGVDLITATTYDANGNKLTTTDPRGNVTTFSYDKRNRLTHVTYADAHQKRFYYDDRGNKIREEDENDVATLWEYDVLNRVSRQAVDMNGNDAFDTGTDLITSFTYNALNAKVTSTDSKGTVTKFEYDALQRLVKKTDGFGGLNYVTTYEYGANSGGSAFDSSGFKPTKVSDPRGYRTEVTYDALYRSTEEKTEYQTGVYATTTKVYDDVSSLTQVTAPAATGQSTGTITKTTYDDLRRPLTTTEAFGTSLAATSSTVYASTGFAWKSTDALGRETRTDYDAAGRAVKTYASAVDDALTSATTLVNPVTETGYDAAGNVSYIINPLGQRTDYAYDNRNRRFQEQQPAVTDATTATSSRPTRITAYDGVSNVIAVQDARGFISTTDYDPARRPVTVTAPPMTKVDGSTVYPTTTSTYDLAGNVLTVTDANGHVTTNTYDALNRLKTSLQKPDTNATHDILVQNEYDAAGNRTAVIDGKAQRTEFTYDGLNRNLTVKDPANHSVTFTYDALNKTTRVDSLGQQTNYGYDVRHRLTDVTYVARTQDNRSYAYDLVGQLLTVTEPGKAGKADVAYTYDALGRQLTETSGGQTHAYAYDLASNRVTVTYGGTGTVLASTYDALNRLATLTEGTRTTTYGYDLNGNRILQQLPNGEETGTQYDPLGRSVAITTSRASGALLLQLTQAYDPAGNLIKLVERQYGSTLALRTVTNTYDGVNRLVGETNQEGAIKTIATTYGFDAANNRTAKAVATTTGFGTTVVDTAYVYNNLNQLQSAAEGAVVTAFTYDLNGNRVTRVTSGLTDTYAYDYENRLVSLDKDTTGGTGSYAYVYDYRTRRVERTEGGTTTKSVFSGGLSVTEYSGTTATVEYIRGSDWGGGVGGLLYSVRSGVPSFKHYNSRGDVISETNTAGSFTWQGTYEAYGTRTQEVGTTQDRQKANTKEEDPTGLLNEGFRYRDLESGVFITRDPLGFVDGPNMYAYVVQNPWSKFDPEGLTSDEEAAAKKQQEEAAKRMEQDNTNEAAQRATSTGPNESSKASEQKKLALVDHLDEGDPSYVPTGNNAPPAKGPDFFHIGEAMKKDGYDVLNIQTLKGDVNPQIGEYLKANKGNIGELAILDHGNPEKGQEFGKLNNWVKPEWGKSVGEYLAPNANVYMYGCSAGRATGAMQGFANSSGATVHALKIDNYIVRLPRSVGVAVYGHSLKSDSLNVAHFYPQK